AVGEKVDWARRAGAPVYEEDDAVVVETVAGITSTLGGLRIDARARVAPRVWAAGGDAGGIATGGYASGLAAALVFGRIAATAAGATLAGAGLHPATGLGEFRLVESARYRHVEDAMRGLLRRTPECALHVHVGVPDPDGAIRVFNGLRERLPLLAGLAANSPW